MKNFKLIILFSLLPTLHASAQDVWDAYNHVIAAKGYEGHKVRMSAFLKAEVDAADAGVQIWMRSDSQNACGNVTNLGDAIVRTNEWKKYTIESTIDSNAVQFVIGVQCQFNGRFYLDNVQLQIETAPGKWLTVFTDNFETNFNNWKEGMHENERGKSSFFKPTIKHQSAPQGNGYFCIEAKDILVFGSNEKAGKYADVNGIKMYYEVYGKGIPLVVLHGNGGSIAGASPFYPELMKHYKVIAVDSRSQGKSTDTDAPLTYDLMAADVNELLNQLNIDSAFIWGQSDGAIIGILLAKDYPKKVKRVLAFSPNMQHDSLALYPWAIEDIIKGAQSADAHERKLNLMMLNYPDVPYAELSKIKAPVLLMSGDRDIIRPEHMLRLFQSIPNSQFCILPGSTHGASWENQKLFLQLLENFFDKPFEMPDSKN